MPRHRRHTAGPDGWSEWVAPDMAGYRMSCCDCGLVHEMEFSALRVTGTAADGSWTADNLPADEYRVKFRVRRHNRATAQVRRHHGRLP
jgi:hypothetical protein